MAPMQLLGTLKDRRHQTHAYDQKRKEKHMDNDEFQCFAIKNKSFLIKNKTPTTEYSTHFLSMVDKTHWGNQCNRFERLLW